MPRNKELRPRQRQMLDFIAQFADEEGMAPTIRDIQRGCEISSTSVVDYNLRLMERDGYLKRRSDVARGIELLDPLTGLPASQAAASAPVVGAIAAGRPIPAFATEGTAYAGAEVVSVAPELKRKHGDGLYALRVQGDSMVDALVCDGDVVVVKPTPVADNGDMVVAWLRREEEATLKKFYRDEADGEVRLQPANAAMAPLYADADNVEVRGKVVGVLREF